MPASPDPHGCPAVPKPEIGTTPGRPGATQRMERVVDLDDAGGAVVAGRALLRCLAGGRAVLERLRRASGAAEARPGSAIATAADCERLAGALDRLAWRVAAHGVTVPDVLQPLTTIPWATTGDHPSALREDVARLRADVETVVLLLRTAMGRDVPPALAELDAALAALAVRLDAAPRRHSGRDTGSGSS